MPEPGSVTTTSPRSDASRRRPASECRPPGRRARLGSEPTIATIGCWYVRLCQAVLGVADRTRTPRAPSWPCRRAGAKRRSAPSSSCLRHVAKGPRQLARAWARDRWPSGSASAEHPECRGSRRSGALEYHGGSFGELASPPSCVALRGHVVPYRGVDALSCDRFRANCGSVARRSRSTPRPGRWAAAPDMMQVSNRRLPDGVSNRLHGSVSVIGATEWPGAFPPWLPGSAPPRQPLPLLGSSNA